jgi:glutathione reductase (NADPH)
MPEEFDKDGHIQLDQRGAVEVNEFLQSTTNPRVYAAGDVVLPAGSIPLAVVAAVALVATPEVIKLSRANR